MDHQLLTVDLDKRGGPVRPVHGVNLGPLARRWGRDLTEPFRRVGIPSVRLHDATLECGQVVDLHCVFPNPGADPDDPASYDFALTDAYVAAIREAGAEVYFRLGESIEAYQPHKLFIRPDRWTLERMAAVCANIVRHYNQGWADGYQWGVRYWEFWNEPENRWHRPAGERPCWTGSADEFFDFYRATAAAIKACDSSSLVGLAGFTGGFTREWLDAPADDREACAGWGGVVGRCADEGVPVDFVSWHTYPDRWSTIAELATDVRRRLDDLGLGGAESHLTEWNYKPAPPTGQDAGLTANGRVGTEDYEGHEKALATMNSIDGAAFTFGGLAVLQDLPVQRAHFYTGILEPYGIFHLSGRPSMKYRAFEAFADLIAPDAARVGTAAEDADVVAALAVIRDGRLRIGVASLAGAPTRIEVRGASSPLRLQSAREITADGWGDATCAVEDDAVTVERATPGVTMLDVAGA